MDHRTELFERHRRRLLGIACRMLGSSADAEDVLQDAWLRWNRSLHPPPELPHGNRPPSPLPPPRARTVPGLGLSSRLKEGSLGNTLIALVDLRVSQINGCAFCIDMHARELLAADGADLQRLNSVSTWREVDFYSDGSAPRCNGRRASRAWHRRGLRTPIARKPLAG